MDPPPPRPSSAPSWTILGFVLGCLFVLALPRRAPAPDPGRPRIAEPPLPAAAPPRRLTTIEAVFAVWGRYAVWDDDVTEVALWDPAAKAYADDYEVLRAGETYYFRSIPGLTRPVLTHGLPDDPAMPLEFTETAAQRAEWLRESGQENWSVLRQTLHGAEGAPPEPPAP